MTIPFTARAARITVVAPARLHLGFMDLNGDLGRSFGSLGLTISSLRTVVEAEAAEVMSVEGEDSARALRIAERLSSLQEMPGSARIVVRQTIPAHAGFGSGTQLALAVGTALARVNGWDLPPRTIAQLSGRGARSGIGIGAFETGGFIVDGGRGADDVPPHVISRLSFPDSWRILLVFDNHEQGIHGSNESAAFDALPKFPVESAAHLCRLVMMRLLPSLADADIVGFGRAVTALQQTVGDHFAPAQGGRYASPAVSEALAWLESEGAAGVGQSSWGPTGFAILGNEHEAERLLRQAQERWPQSGRLSFMVCRGMNSGASILETSAEPATGHRSLYADAA
ncbi:MAG: GHMP kinase [Betaproteobacteria bacterium]|nr:GHMP kinase [Betaproteobacteria bacterium]